jgi:hypothetical protein
MPSLRNGFTAYFVLSPVNGFLATVADRSLLLPTWRQHRGVRTTRLDVQPLFRPVENAGSAGK